MMNCEICKRIKLIEENKNPTVVCELETGYVVLGDHQRFYGYTLFLCKQHVREIHDLDKAFLSKHLMEMALVQEAVCHAFNADKMNVESLGNGDAHVHWHLFPRVAGDTPQPGPVWWIGKDEMYDDKYSIDFNQIDEMKQKLRFQIERLKKQYQE